MSLALTSGQSEFAADLTGLSGLNQDVVIAWLYAEENGSAAAARQAAGNNDWLNIGYTDTATIGSADSIWRTAQSAATASYEWLKGQQSVPGYGTASAGIQAILRTAGESPARQIAAIQSSGWASSGYPDLPQLYQQASGTSLPGAQTGSSTTTGGQIQTTWGEGAMGILLFVVFAAGGLWLMLTGSRRLVGELA